MWDRLQTTGDNQETSFFGNDGNRSSIFDEQPADNAKTVFERFRERSSLRASRVSSNFSFNNEPTEQVLIQSMDFDDLALPIYQSQDQDIQIKNQQKPPKIYTFNGDQASQSEICRSEMQSLSSHLQKRKDQKNNLLGSRVFTDTKDEIQHNRYKQEVLGMRRSLIIDERVQKSIENDRPSPIQYLGDTQQSQNGYGRQSMIELRLSRERPQNNGNTTRRTNDQDQQKKDIKVEPTRLVQKRQFAFEMHPPKEQVIFAPINQRKQNTMHQPLSKGRVLSLSNVGQNLPKQIPSTIAPLSIQSEQKLSMVEMMKRRKNTTNQLQVRSVVQRESCTKRVNDIPQQLLDILEQMQEGNEDKSPDIDKRRKSLQKLSPMVSPKILLPQSQITQVNSIAKSNQQKIYQHNRSRCKTPVTQNRIQSVMPKFDLTLELPFGRRSEAFQRQSYQSKYFSTAQNWQSIPNNLSNANSKPKSSPAHSVIISKSNVNPSSIIIPVDTNTYAIPNFTKRNTSVPISSNTLNTGSYLQNFAVNPLSSSKPYQQPYLTTSNSHSGLNLINQDQRYQDELKQLLYEYVQRSYDKGYNRIRLLTLQSRLDALHRKSENCATPPTKQ